MRTTSFILAFAFILAGPSMAGSSDRDLPGVGTFAYNGSPVEAPQPVVLASNQDGTTALTCDVDYIHVSMNRAADGDAT